jgi:hypothetical protein
MRWPERLRQLQSESAACPAWLRAIMGKSSSETPSPRFNDTRILTCACGSKVYQDCDTGKLRNDYYGTLHTCEAA